MKYQIIVRDESWKNSKSWRTFKETELQKPAPKIAPAAIYCNMHFLTNGEIAGTEKTKIEKENIECRILNYLD